MVAKLNTELNRALTNPAVVQRLLDQGVEATPGSARGFCPRADRFRDGALAQSDQEPPASRPKPVQ